MNERLKAAHDKLQSAVADIVSGDESGSGCSWSFPSSTDTVSTIT